MAKLDDFTVWIRTKVDLKGIKDLNKLISKLGTDINLSKRALNSFGKLLVEKPSFRGFKKALSNVNDISKGLGKSVSDVSKALSDNNIAVNKTGKFYDTLHKRTLTYGRTVNILSNAFRRQDREKAARERAAQLELERLQEIYSSTNPLIGLSERLGISQKKLSKAMGFSALSLEQFTVDGKMYYAFVDRATGQTIKLNTALGKVSRASRRFRFENLSFLFLTMQISRTLGGWIRQVSNLIGMNDIFGTILQVVLMPVLLGLLDPLLSVLSFFEQHPTVAKMTGGIILAAAAFSALSFWVTQISFAVLAADILRFSNRVTDLTGKGGPLSLLSSKLSSIASIAAKGISIALGFKYIYDGLSEINEGDLWSGIGDTLKGAGFIAVGIGKPAAGVAAASIGIGFKLIGKLSGEDVDKMAAIENALTELSGLLVTAGLANFGKVGGKIMFGVGIGFYISKIFADKTKSETYKLGIELGGSIIGGLSVALIGKYGGKAIKALGSLFSKGRGAAPPSYVGVTGVPIVPTFLLKYAERFSPYGAGGFGGAAQFGRNISRSGLYYLHAGEVVTSPTGRNINNNPTFNINVYGSSDPKRTANEVLRIIRPEFERITNTRMV